jgi:hypothetical protein
MTTGLQLSVRRIGKAGSQVKVRGTAYLLRLISLPAVLQTSG